ncbi:MAG: PEGA domain-containing protein, partial [Myxococcota bacterium]
DRGAPVVARVEPAAAPEPAPPAPVGVLAPRPERAESPRPEPPRPVGPGPAERTPTPVVASDRAIAASARPDPEPAPAPDQGLALVRLNSGDFLADVYLRGIKLGDTRSDLPLPAGTYELELRSPVFFDHVEKVTVTSGERLVVPVTLRPRPSRVAFAKSWPGACLVSTNGSEVGTLESVGWRVEVDRPDRPVALSVTCPDGRTATERWSNLGAPEVTFEGAR